MPAIIRERRSIRKEFATAKTMKLTMEVRIDSRRIGLLPRLSDILPNIGEKMNCIIENEATRTPKAVDPA